MIDERKRDRQICIERMAHECNKHRQDIVRMNVMDR